MTKNYTAKDVIKIDVEKYADHKAATIRNAEILENVLNRLEALEYLHSPAVAALADNQNETAADPDAPKEKPERLTIRDWRNLDPWETCGNQFYCARGNCLKTACIVPKLYAKLAAIEDEQEATLKGGRKRG